MGDAYILWGGILLTGLLRIIYFFYQKRQRRQTDIEIADRRWDDYLKLRQVIISTQPVELNINLPEDKEIAFGVAMEVHLETEVHFFAIFKTGIVYVLSNLSARKDIYNTKNENAISAINSLFNIAQYHFARMRKHYTNVLEPGDLKFYIFTNEDVYSANAAMQDIYCDEFLWQELMNNIQEVLKQSQKV